VKIHSSHLALRFYLREGWTREMVERYVVNGKIDECFPGDGDFAYFRPDIGCTIDCEMLLKDGHIVERNPTWIENHKSDLEYLRIFN